MSLVIFDMPYPPKLCHWIEDGQRMYCPSFNVFENRCNVLNDFVPYSARLSRTASECPIVDVLPVRIGTPVWQIMFNTIREGRVAMLQQKADGTWKFRVSFPGSSGVYDYKMSEIGKCEDCSIHLSKAMAERALLRLSSRVEE